MKNKTIMDFIIEDFRGREYIVTAEKDCDGFNCLVYKKDDNGQYEKESSACFFLLDAECYDINNEEDVLDAIQDLFYDKEEFYLRIYSLKELGDDEEEDDDADTPSAGIKYFEDRGKRLLKQYAEWEKDKSSMNCGIELLEEMRDFICDFVYSE